MMNRKQISKYFLLPESAAVTLERNGEREDCTAVADLAADYLRRLRLVQIAGARAGKAGKSAYGGKGQTVDYLNLHAEICALESELECDGVAELFNDAHSEFYRDGTINPNDRDSGTVFHFQFGAYGCTHVYVWARSCEDGLELAAEYVAKHYPGHIEAPDSEHMQDLYREACEEKGLVYPPVCDHADMEELGYYAAFESAEADLTYTESGYLTSYEWTVDECDGPPGPDSK